MREPGRAGCPGAGSYDARGADPRTQDHHPDPRDAPARRAGGRGGALSREPENLNPMTVTPRCLCR